MEGLGFSIVMTLYDERRVCAQSTDIENLKHIHSFLYNVYYSNNVFVKRSQGTPPLVSWGTPFENSGLKSVLCMLYVSVPAALLARSLLGQVHLMSVAMVVYDRSGQRSEVGQGAELG